MFCGPVQADFNIGRGVVVRTRSRACAWQWEARSRVQSADCLAPFFGADGPDAEAAEVLRQVPRAARALLLAGGWCGSDAAGVRVQAEDAAARAEFERRLAGLASRAAGTMDEVRSGPRARRA